jgi:hypothetical protein
MKTMRTELKEFYLDYFNNYINVETIAEHHQIAYEYANKLLKMGKEIHEADIEYYGELTLVETKGLDLNKIKLAIERGKKVYWKTSIYEVIKDKIGQYLIVCSLNNYTVGLCKADGSLRDNPNDFYMEV